MLTSVVITSSSSSIEEVGCTTNFVVWTDGSGSFGWPVPLASISFAVTSGTVAFCLFLKRILIVGLIPVRTVSSFDNSCLVGLLTGEAVVRRL